MVRNDGQTSIVAPSQTGLGANAMLLTYAFWFNNGTTPAWPGTMTVRVPAGPATTSGVAAEELLPTAGVASGSRTFTLAAAPSSFTATSLLLEAAA
jgi:hypothetical protein